MGCKVIFHDSDRRIVCGMVAKAEHVYDITDYLKIHLFDGHHGAVYKFAADIDTINGVIEKIYDNDKVDLRYFDIKACAY